MVAYTPAEAGMWKMIVIRNRMRDLYGLFDVGTAPSIALQYGVQELVQFVDAYDGLMGRLTDEQNKRVQCATDLISGVVEHRGALREMRNSWLAHPQDDGLFAEGAPGFVRRAGLPADPAAYYEMLACAVIFADTVRALLPEVAGPAVEKFNRTGDARPERYCDVLNRVACNVRGRIEAARRGGGAGVPRHGLGPADRCRRRPPGPARSLRPPHRRRPRERAVRRGCGTAMTPPAPRPRPGTGPVRAAAGAPRPPRPPSGLSRPGRSRAERGASPP